MRSRCLMLLTASGLLFGPDASPVQAKSGPPELKKLHVLLVFDTNDPKKKFNDSLRRDLRNLESLLKRAVPEGRFTKRVLQGSDVNKRTILGYFDKLTVGPEEGLLFYYCGHGGIDKKTRKPYFQIRSGDVYRDEVLAAMKRKGGLLTVMLSDCCSSLVDRKVPAEVKLDTPRGIVLQDKVRSLFFQARGTIDITAAAADTPSWSDYQQGGVFTRTFCSLLLDHQFAALDKDGDGQITWPEFFPTLQAKTNTTFKAWRQKMDPRGEFVTNKEQIPAAFLLEQEAQAKAPAPAGVKVPLKKTYAMVGLKNSTAETFTYRLRWAGKEWIAGNKILPGETRVHSVPLPSNSELPMVEVEFDEKLPGVQRWPSHEWARDTAPTKSSLQELQEIYERTK